MMKGQIVESIDISKSCSYNEAIRFGVSILHMNREGKKYLNTEIALFVVSVFSALLRCAIVNNKQVPFTSKKTGMYIVYVSLKIVV